MKGSATTGLGQNPPPTLYPPYEKSTDLFLDKCQLFQIPFQERHLLLLGLAVAVSDDIVVLLANFVQLNLQLNHLINSLEILMNQGRIRLSHLLTTILQVSHKVLLNSVKLCELYADSLSSAFKVLRALREVFSTLDSRRRDGKCPLSGDQRSVAVSVRPAIQVKCSKP